MCKLFKIFCSSFAVSFMGFFSSIKIPNVLGRHSLSFYLCNPFISSCVPRHSFETRSVMASFDPVTAVCLPSRFSKIFPSIVFCFVIKVIYLFLGPFIRHNYPNQPVRKVKRAAYASAKITGFWVETACALTCELCGPRSGFTNISSVLPIQKSCFRIVTQNRTYELCAKIVARVLTRCYRFFSHDGLFPLLVRKCRVDHQSAFSIFISSLCPQIKGI